MSNPELKQLMSDFIIYEFKRDSDEDPMPAELGYAPEGSIQNGFVNVVRRLTIPEVLAILRGDETLMREMGQ